MTAADKTSEREENPLEEASPQAPPTTAIKISPQPGWWGTIGAEMSGCKELYQLLHGVSTPDPSLEVTAFPDIYRGIKFMMPLKQALQVLNLKDTLCPPATKIAFKGLPFYIRPFHLTKEEQVRFGAEEFNHLYILTDGNERVIGVLLRCLAPKARMQPNTEFLNFNFPLCSRRISTTTKVRYERAVIDDIIILKSWHISLRQDYKCLEIAKWYFPASLGNFLQHVLEIKLGKVVVSGLKSKGADYGESPAVNSSLFAGSSGFSDEGSPFTSSSQSMPGVGRNTSAVESHSAHREAPFKGAIFSDFAAATEKAQKENKPIFMVIYDPAKPDNSKLAYSLGYFLQYESTKDLVSDNFIQLLTKKDTRGVAPYVPNGETLDNCMVVIIAPDGTPLIAEGVYANPDVGLKYANKYLARWRDYEASRPQGGANTAEATNTRDQQYLSELHEVSSTVGFGRLIKGEPISQGSNPTIGGHLPRHALYAHAPSSISYNLAGRGFTSLRGGASIIDGFLGEVQFIVLGDGNELWRSPVIKRDGMNDILTEKFDIDIDGVQQLVLAVDDLGDRNSDHSIWIDPQVLRGNASASPPKLVATREIAPTDPDPSPPVTPSAFEENTSGNSLTDGSGSDVQRVEPIRNSTANTDGISAQVASQIREFTGGWGKGAGSGKDKRQREFAFTALQAKHSGDWDSSVELPDGKIPGGSLPALLEFMSKESKGKILTDYKNVEYIELKSDKIFATKPPFIFFTGSKDFVLTEEEVRTLHKYIRLGGAIWGNSQSDGSSAFDTAFRREMRRVMRDKEKDFEPITAEDFDLGREPYFTKLMRSPEAAALRYYGELAVIHTVANFSGKAPASQQSSPPPTSDSVDLQYGVNLITHLLTRWEERLRSAPRL